MEFSLRSVAFNTLKTNNKVAFLMVAITNMNKQPSTTNKVHLIGEVV